ncbi:MAG TPA: beta-N-acetylhexosaminidase [Sphingomicrobium sp.]|nr:beta-N-acetylhexosaminidase [Sphingomicrobium sp.]
MQAAIYGLSGTQLTAGEADFFRDAKPAGYILFRRNIETRQQLRQLTDSLRDLEGHDGVPILIDQEGGRVARMRPPEWPAFPSGEAFDRLYQLAPSSAIEAARVNARALGLMLAECGVTVDCLPLVDVRQEGASDIIGDRALGSEPMQVSALGRAQLDGLASAGVIGVVKHIPGHGRALVDSHHELPFVTASDEELAIDLEPFERLRDAPMAMVAHVVYEAWDKGRPASQSPTVIHDIIRQRIGFDGFLMSDDSNMNALTGTQGKRAAACVAAGCDVALPCDGVLANNIDVAKAVPALSPAGEARLARAMAMRFTPDDDMDFAEAVAKRDALLALV